MQRPWRRTVPGVLENSEEACLVEWNEQGGEERSEGVEGTGIGHTGLLGLSRILE